MIFTEKPTGFSFISVEINIPIVGLKEPAFRYSCKVNLGFHMVAVSSCYIQGEEKPNALYLHTLKSLLY